MPNALTLTPDGVALFRHPEYDDVTGKLNHDVPGIIVTTIGPYAYDVGPPHWIVRTPAESEWHGAEMAVRVDQLTPIDAGKLEECTRGFVRAWLWTDAIPNGMRDDGETGGLQDREPTAELRERARLFCARFLATADRSALQCHMDVFGDPDGGHPAEYVGHTFYLDAAGHGVSFLDRARECNAPANAALIETLHDVARTFGDVEHLCAFELADGTVGL